MPKPEHTAFPATEAISHWRFSSARMSEADAAGIEIVDAATVEADASEAERAEYWAEDLKLRSRPSPSSGRRSTLVPLALCPNERKATGS